MALDVASSCIIKLLGSKPFASRTVVLILHEICKSLLSGMAKEPTRRNAN